MTATRDLLRTYGSPLYIYETTRIDLALGDLRSALPEGAGILYSFKANPHPDLARILRAAGCGAEISSPGELAAAAAAGFFGDRCFYTGPAKGPDELGRAIGAGVRRFSVESLSDLGRVGAAAVGQEAVADCLVRVSGAAGGAGGLRMAGRNTQFGVPADSLLADVRAFMNTAGTRIRGAHFFPVSNARDETSLAGEFLSSIRSAARLRDAGLPLELLDLGGGFAAPFATRRQRPRYPGLRALLERALDTHLSGWRDGAPAVIFESGRYLVADSGALASTVVEVKRAGGGVHVLMDSGINHLGGMSASGRLMRPEVTPFLDGDDGTAGAAAREDEPVTVAGPLCTPADVLGHGLPLGKAEAGDVVVVPNVGAYGVTAGLLAFLSRPAPAEVVLSGGRVVSASRIELRRRPVG